MHPEILIGTSGYSYDDWRGAFYPLRLAKGKMLEYYTREFSFTEVNSTFYHIPPARVMEALVKKTPEGFVFAVKAHGSLTHEREAEFTGHAGKFRAVLQPLEEAGKLGAVLFQFPFSFPNSPGNRDYLARLRELFPDVPAAVEFRHASWVEQSTFDLLRSLNFAYVCVDEPRLKGLVGPVAVRTADFAYVRFHGRNAAKWWRHGEAWERYDYLYSQEELEEWVPRVRSVAEGSKRTFVAFNNHPRGQAVQNARMLRETIRRLYL
ncbi:uncharacterized protein YecE (DUF72 family) [Thermodesulfitimonas autotrophica]|uniref:Uncharacterized protein YecE (DUF72 family) n=1 Tax=Thermodesulfitimonas autotrophica TaxID=1894989 RepID=A0A3N5BII6_9THEO|nr:DUF72 domain-containing protein [Thermodesulfitimonas autotrophica]RPF49478.1 uncharacterized protein YecE (DUF72 family) [Thermodesulfitimonas autotrophica]